MRPGDVRLTLTVGRLTTARGVVEVIFNTADAIYELLPESDGFEDALLALFRSWRNRIDVAVVIRGITVQSATPVG